MIDNHAGVLPKALADESFAFFGKTLFGTPQQRPRWQRGVFVVDRWLGDAVGKIYAERYFPPEAKAKAQEMVANITAAFRKRVEALPWMAPATKAEALEKLNALYVGIGYPEDWHDYSAYEVKANDAFGNLWRGSLFEYHRDVGGWESAGGPQRVVNVTADRQRRESSAAKWAQLSGGDSATAVL